MYCVRVSRWEKERPIELSRHTVCLWRQNRKNCIKCFLFANDDPALKQFLKGEEIAVPNHLKGFTGIAVEGVLTGFGKCSAGRLKNRYPKGLRNFSYIHYIFCTAA